MSVALPEPDTSGSDVARTEFALWKAMAWMGPVFAGIASLGFVLAGFLPPPRQEWDVERIAAFYRDNAEQVRGGALLMIFAACFMYLWSLALWRLMVEVEGRRGLMSWVQLIGGFGTAFVLTGSAIMWALATFRVEERTPDVIQAFSDVGFFIFELGAMVTLFELVAVGVVFLAYPHGERFVPRWFSYLSFWIAFTFMGVFVMPWVTDGPFAWDGIVNFWLVLVLFFLWLVALTVYLVRGIATLERDQHAVSHA